MTESAIRNFGPPPEKSSEQIAAEMISRVQDEGFPTEAQFEDYKKRLFEGGNLNAPLGPIRIVERDGP